MMQPTTSVKAKVVFIHGFSDHINNHLEFFPTLAEAGIAVYGFDQRGWGRSVTAPSQRGSTGPTATVLADLAAFIGAQLPSEAPVFAIGFSMGGAELLTLASTPEYEDLVAQLRGLILEAPHIAFAPEQVPSRLLVLAGRLGARVLPHLQMHAETPPVNITRNQDVIQHTRDDPLIYNQGTLEGLAGLVERSENLDTGRVHLSDRVGSLMLMHGTGDKACSYERSKAWFDRQKLDDGQFKTYDGWYHLLHAEPERLQFYRDVTDWILARTEAQAPHN